jgi:hypothetical protein
MTGRGQTFERRLGVTAGWPRPQSQNPTQRAQRHREHRECGGMGTEEPRARHREGGETKGRAASRARKICAGRKALPAGGTLGRGDARAMQGRCKGDAREQFELTGGWRVARAASPLAVRFGVEDGHRKIRRSSMAKPSPFASCRRNSCAGYAWPFWCVLR